ncbi:uncharacterized protein LOC131425973 [Malaya genurostris]|uniref:uncharacterized protein LOC131425973 n=1 Tax=Malaya genurostris TaxID=325434 RepID=UPI0026F3ABB7|nr:uncharacterized protein LOC131425973 [Malaya genurostris]
MVLDSNKHNSMEPDKKEMTEDHQASVLRSADLTLNQVRKLRSSVGNEFIKKKIQTGGKISDLNFSARLTLEALDIKLHSEGRLMLVDDDLLARVTIVKPDSLDETCDFEQAKKVLLEQIRIEEVFFDGLPLKRNQLRGEFISTLEDVGMKSATDRRFAMDCISLRKMLEKMHDCERPDYQYVCEEIVKNQTFSAQLTNAAAKLYDVECFLKRRGELLPCIGAPHKTDWSEFPEALERMLSTASDVHRKRLQEQAPEYLSGRLGSVSPEKIMLASSGDVGILTDVGHILDGVDFRKPLENLACRFTANVNDFVINDFSLEKSLINPTFILLCKSLKGLLREIVSNSGMTYSDLVQTDTGTGWQPAHEIAWNIEGNSSKCWERQYYFLFKLLKHFEPGSNVDWLSFEHKPRFFVGCENDSLVIDSSQTQPESFIWYCLLDDALLSIAPGNRLMKYENIFQKYVSLIHEAKRDQLEFVRVVSHALADFIACTVEAIDLEIDSKILQKQIQLLIPEISFDSSTKFGFCEMVKIFTTFWNHRRNIIATIPAKIDAPEMSDIQKTLLDIVLWVSKTDAEADEFLDFFYVYNDYVLKLAAVPFEWLIESIPGVEMQAITLLKLIEPVDDEKDVGIFRVLDPPKFVPILQILHRDAAIPKHQVWLIVMEHLSLILQQLVRDRWISGLGLSESEQITTTTALILTLTKRLLDLQEELKYYFFPANENSLTDSVRNSRSSNEFELQIYRKELSQTWTETEKDFSKSLKKCDDLNKLPNQQLLRDALQKFSERYQQYMSMAEESRVALIVRKLKATKMLHFSCWCAQFKQDQLPKILAAISALWCTFTFEHFDPDVEQSPELHSYQILSIMRLLSVDDPETGVCKHFSEIPPGEGKTMIVRLIAVLLALTGHSVRVLCCNEFQTERNRVDLNRVFADLDIHESISYSTVKNLIGSSPVLFNGKRVYLSGFAEDSNEYSASAKRILTGNLDSSVLLIDDANIFRCFYNHVAYQNSLSLVLPGLDIIQAKIWSLTVETTGADSIKDRIYEYVQSSEFPEKDRWKKFLIKPVQFQLLSEDDEKISYTTESWFETHLTEMIQAAGKVHRKDLRDNGCSYYEVFKYLATEDRPAASPVFGDRINYGYLTIKLPSLDPSAVLSDFPLVFGVFGTTFDQAEKSYLEQTGNIKQWTKMPSVFGDSKLLFDKDTNFCCLDNKFDWMDKIFRRAKTAVKAHRSVLIVFVDKQRLTEFENIYGNRLSQVNILSESTPNVEKQRVLNEVGVAETVTLVHWEMVPGLDHQSSRTVEKSGGVHVIQTFFSAYVTEENRIKKLTARRGNKGSYELIVTTATSGFCKSSYNECNTSRTRVSQNRLRKLPRVHSKLTEQNAVLRSMVDVFKF